ncbi:MAG: extracellular solute-binding protein [Litoreibacter sp.]|uniref:extracellular solute-binding protein n=1 Tax=Litoreibacter sp. TaxID=1969459 RepID=UPI003297C37A
MTNRQLQALAKTRTQPNGRMKWMGAGLLLVAATLTSVTAARGQDVTISHGYSNFGELKYGPDFPHLDYVNPNAPKGGEVSTWALGNFDSFNQYARDGVPAALNTIGSESVLTSTADDPYGVYCFMCTTLEYPEDLSFVTFNLRKDVTFSDGTPMTAEDIAFSFNLFLEQGISEYRRIVEGFIDKVEVINPYRIKFSFNEAASKRDRVTFAGGTVAFSKAWFEENDIRLDKSSDRPFLSTGAYVLDSFDYNRQVIYARNPEYWGNDIPFNKGRNNFDRIRIEYFADRSAAFEAFKSGEYLLKSETDPKDWATGYNFPAVLSGDVKQESISDGDVGEALSFVFNLDREKWQDPKVREAVSLLFNFEWSNKALFFGLYERPKSFWPNSELAAQGAPTPEEIALLQPLVDEGLLAESILTDEVAMPFVHDDSKNRPSRKVLRRASKLLDEAGWEVGGDGVRRKDGEALTLNVIQFNPLYDRIVNPFIDNLKAIGIQADLERVDTAQYVERRRKGDFDLANQRISMNSEPSIGLGAWFSSKTADSSSRNLMRLRDPAVDALIPKVIAADTLDELRTSVHAMDRVLRSIGFAIPQWYKKDNWVAYFDVFRHPEELPPLAVGIYDFWWYDAEAAERLKASGALR